ALGLETSASITDYSHQTANNNTSYSAGPYLEWQMTHFIHLSLHGGPTFYIFAGNSSEQSGNNLGSYYVNFDLTHQLTPYIAEELMADRSVSLGYTLGTTYTEQLSASYLVRWYPKPWLNIWLGLNYQDGKQPYDYFVNYGFFSIPVSTIENFDRYGISAGISYQITQKISASTTYSYWTRGSNVSGNSYSDDSINFQFQYTF
ncbi:MAG: hypothetical protein ABSE48_10365, partial [Verrucomicrobiota bacterium]